MGKFKFRLESLLRIYQNREEEAQREVRACTEQLQRTREELLILSDRHIKALRLLVESQQGSISVHQVINNHHFCQHLKVEVESKQQEVVKQEMVLEEKKSNLLDIVKQRKMLEKLKDKQYIHFLSDEQRVLQKELDEMASNLSIS